MTLIHNAYVISFLEATVHVEGRRYIFRYTESFQR